MTLGTNYWDNKRVCELLFPLLNPGARVVNVSSFVGALGNLIKWGHIFRFRALSPTRYFKYGTPPSLIGLELKLSNLIG